MAVTFSGGWSTLKGLFSFGGVVNADEGPQYSGPTSRANDANLVYTDERAMQVSAVWACARLITETVGSLPLHCYEKTPDGRTESTNHFLYRMFIEQPNSMMTPLEFREALTLALVLWGNAYALIEWDGVQVVSLSPLRPDCMTPKRIANTITYHYQTNKGVHVFAYENILHIKGFGADGMVGLSPLSFAAQAMGITLSADKYASRAFSKGGRPAGILTTDKILTPDQRIALRTLYGNINADDSDGTWVLEAGLGYTTINIPPDQLQMLQTRSFQISELARYFLVPPHMIGDVSKSTSWGTGIEQQNLGFLAYTLRPYLTRWEAAVAGKLLSIPDRRKYFISHNVEGLLRADSAARSAFYSTAAQNGWMTRNEIRQKENLEPMEGGDELTVQVNLTPVTELPSLNKPVQGEPQGEEDAGIQTQS